MPSVEELSLLIDVIDNFSLKLDQLLFKLGQVELAAREVDPIDIDVDVDDGELDRLLTKMGAARGAGVGGGTRGAGSGRAAALQTRRFANAMDDAERSSSLLDLRMTDMHNALAKLVPLLLVMIGALPALLTALVALAAAAVSAAAALAALTGFGALGFALARGGRGNLMEGLTEAWTEIVEDFLDAFAPLAQRLTPLFEDMLDGLDRMFQAIANRGGALRQLTDEARAFGGFLLEFIPDMLENMARMVEAFAPLFGQLGEFLNERSFLAFLTSFMRDALPAFMGFLDVLLQILPTLVRVSIGFLDMLSVVLLTVDAFGRLFSVLGLGEEAFGLMIAAILTAITAMNILSFTALKNAAIAFATLVVDLIQAVGAIDVYTAATWQAVFASNALGLALAALISIVTLGVGLAVMAGIASQIADSFFRTGEGIRDATAALGEFERARGRMGGESSAGLQPGSASGRFRGSTAGVTNINVDNRGRDRDDADAQLDRAMWKSKRQSGKTVGNSSG